MTPTAAWLAAEEAIEATGLPRYAFHVEVTPDGRALVTSRVAGLAGRWALERVLGQRPGVVTFTESAAA